MAKKDKPADKTEPLIKTSIMDIDGKEYTVISIFQGTETASKLMYDLAVNRILYENTDIGNNFLCL